MILTFKKIKLHNFFSFKDVELDLNDMGYTLVSGRNYCKLDSAYSNGSGKSSIFNGICFALTGETVQGISNGVENIFSDPNDCWVELTFYADSDEFILKRFKTPRPDLKIYINGEDKSGKGIRESAKLLTTYLPDMTSELVNSVIILGQGLPNRFSNNNPAGRKEILEKLTKSDFMIQSIKNKLEIRQTELKLKLREKEDLLLTNKSQLEIYNNQLKEYNSELLDYEQYDSSENELDNLILKSKKELEIVNNKILEVQNNIDLASNNIVEINDKISNLTKQSNDELNSLLTPFDNNLNNLNNELIETKADIKTLELEIKRLNSITDICPTCGQKIPDVIKPDSTKQVNLLSDAKRTLKELQILIKNINENKQRTIKEHNKKYNDLILENNLKLSEFNKELDNLKNESSKLVDKRSSLQIEIYRLTNLNDNYNKLLANINNVCNIIDTCNSDITRLESDVVLVNSHLAIVQQMITLAKREFRGVLLINFIKFIDSKIKQYSREVFGTESLSFTLNENAIDITYCDKPYENLSGGEKQKVDVIVQLALRDILSKQLGIRSNLLVCDEIFDNLDTQGCSKILNLLSSLTDVDSVFIISHHAQDLELTKDNEIIVEKNESGLSTLRFI